MGFLVYFSVAQCEPSIPWNRLSHEAFSRLRNSTEMFHMIAGARADVNLWPLGWIPGSSNDRSHWSLFVSVCMSNRRIMSTKRRRCELAWVIAPCRYVNGRSYLIDNFPDDRSLTLNMCSSIISIPLTKSYWATNPLTNRLCLRPDPI